MLFSLEYNLGDVMNSNFLARVRNSSFTQPSVLFSLYIVATSVLSEFLLDFDSLLSASTFLLVLLIALYLWGLKGQYHTADWRIPASFAIIALLALGVTLLRYFDEPTRYYVLSSIANSNYPPVEPAFPKMPMNYYWRTDIIPAFFAHWFGLSALGAGIALNILIIQFSLQPIWSWANRESSNTMWLLAPIVFFSGSAITIVGSAYWHLGFQEITYLKAYGEQFNVPVISYFGQTPFSHAFPAIVGIIIFCCGGEKSFDLTVPAVGLSALAIIHTVSFAALLPVVLLVTMLRGRPVATILILVVPFTLGYYLNPQVSDLLSGFFADDTNTRFRFRMGAIDGDPLRTAIFNVAQFGFVLFAPVLFLFTKSDRVSKIAVLCIFFGCLASFNFVKYELSWDMVKLLTLLTISSGIWFLYIYEKSPPKLRIPIFCLIFVLGTFDSLMIYQRSNRVGLFEEGFGRGVLTRFTQMTKTETEFTVFASEFRDMDRVKSIVISNVEGAEYQLLLNGQAVAGLYDFEWERGLDENLLWSREILLDGWEEKDFSALYGNGIEILLTDCSPYPSVGVSELSRVANLRAYLLSDLSGSFNASFFCR